MAVEYIPLGEAFSDINPDHLIQPIAKQTLSVCATHSDFEVVELRCLKGGDNTVSDIIVVDCVNGQVPSRNSFGIKVRERLALVFSSGHSPEVRALRKDFPENVPHLNYVGLGQPAWLCIYFEPWGTVERTWTPQKFLRRILWWLSETAKGTLHRDDQPLERLYYESPMEIVLPPDFEEKIKDQQFSFTCQSVERSPRNIRAIRGLFIPKTEKNEQRIYRTEVLMLELPPVVHGTIELYPKTLGQFHDQFEDRGGEFISKLKSLIQDKVPQTGLTRDTQSRCLLIFTIPVKRTAADVEPESHEVRAFIIVQDLATLGEAVCVLTAHDGIFYVTPFIGTAAGDEIAAWREIEIVPVEVKHEPDKAFARKASGVNEDTADFKGVLLGVGALGSAIAELWSKEAWGSWTFIDPDTLEPHNIIRHAGKNHQIGLFKVDAVKNMIEANYHPGYHTGEAIADSATKTANSRVINVISGADLLVDATTTIHVPRDLSHWDDTPRSVSVFLTPSGYASALLLESADRCMRLDSLEAQYYRAIINSDWGATHLNGHKGVLWVGAGCRDVSAVISNESIQLYAAVIARQVRLLRDKPEPRIRIWSTESETGALFAADIPVQEQMATVCGEWEVKWDAGLYQKLCSMRHAHLPKETGGILLGYIDQMLKSVYIVDALSAPPDSDADLTGFTRGVEGLEATLNEVTQRTANIVNYIGEWHSHPSFTSAYPSSLDRALIEKLANTLALEGQPALMIIVGSAGEMSVSIKRGLR